MSKKHLRQGSICPTLSPGVLRCYSMRFCPFAQRTLLVLHAKGINFELVNIHLKDRPDWFLKKNPLGKVPVLEQDGKIMIESLITCEYLDSKYPHPPLLPHDPWMKAREKGFVDIVNAKIISPMHKALYNMGGTSQLNGLILKVQEGLYILEQELSKRTTTYFGGADPGLLDYALWPWCERFPIISYISNGQLEIISTNKFPKLSQYIEVMNTNKTVEETKISVEEHVEFVKSMALGEPNYDYQLNSVAKL